MDKETLKYQIENPHFMKQLIDEIIATAKLSPRIYFAPLIGALRGIKHEYSKLLLGENHE